MDFMRFIRKHFLVKNRKEIIRFNDFGGTEKGQKCFVFQEVPNFSLKSHFSKDFDWENLIVPRVG